MGLAVVRTDQVALLAEGVDRNYYSRFKGDFKMSASPSSRRAWIEIYWEGAELFRGIVALLAEGVDRNWSAS